MDWVKVIHLLCVMGWMTGIFAVPRGLIYWKREHARIGELGPAGDFTFRLFRFAGGLAVIAVLTGLWLAWWWGFPAWVWLKLGLVTLLAAHYTWTGSLVLKARRGDFGHSETWLRVFNEVSVLGTLAVLWVVVFKPF
jgi:Predicted membrane protein